MLLQIKKCLGGHGTWGAEIGTCIFFINVLEMPRLELYILGSCQNLAGSQWVNSFVHYL